MVCHFSQPYIDRALLQFYMKPIMIECFGLHVIMQKPLQWDYIMLNLVSKMDHNLDQWKICGQYWADSRRKQMGKLQMKTNYDIAFLRNSKSWPCCCSNDDYGTIQKKTEGLRRYLICNQMLSPFPKLRILNSVRYNKHPVCGLHSYMCFQYVYII